MNKNYQSHKIFIGPAIVTASPLMIPFLLGFNWSLMDYLIAGFLLYKTNKL